MKRSIFAYIIALSVAYLSSLGNVYANDDKDSIIESLLAAESGDDCRATYSVEGQTLAIPCVEVSGESASYAVQMQQVTDSDPLAFSMTQIKENATRSDGSCQASYAVETGKLDLPCVDVVNPSGDVESRDMVLWAQEGASVFVVGDARSNRSGLRSVRAGHQKGTPYEPNLKSECYNGNNSFAWGQCTWFVYGRVCEKTGIRLKFNPKKGRHGKNWYNYIQGLNKGTKIRKNAIVSWGYGQYGHVAFVEDIKADGSIKLSEANATGCKKNSTGVWHCSTNYDGVVTYSSEQDFINKRGRGNSINGYIYLPDTEPKLIHPADNLQGVNPLEGIEFAWKGDGTSKSFTLIEAENYGQTSSSSRVSLCEKINVGTSESFSFPSSSCNIKELKPNQWYKWNVTGLESFYFKTSNQGVKRPSLTEPFDGQEDVNPSNLTFKWENNNPIANISRIDFTLRKIEGQDVGEYVGSCGLDGHGIDIGVVKELSLSSCDVDSLEPNTPYKWAIGLYFGSDTVPTGGWRGYFTTTGSELTLKHKADKLFNAMENKWSITPQPPETQEMTGPKGTLYYRSYLTKGNAIVLFAVYDGGFYFYSKKKWSPKMNLDNANQTFCDSKCW